MSAFVEVRRGVYYDSVTLMAVSRDVGTLNGVTSALVAMATELNLSVLADLAFAPVEAGPDDLLVAVRARDDAALDVARSAIEGALAGGEAAAPSGWETPAPRTVGAAAQRVEADLALISVPGQHAFVEARDALRAGLGVMIFSDNVPIAQEVALKEEGARRGLLVMGPDCGTALVDGVALGFCNAVRRGPVGIVAASGTGAQQVACLLDEAGIGLSAILGVGGRDLSEEVGGAAALLALARLDADPATERIILVSKTPAPAVADRVRAAAADCETPVTLGFVGPGQPDLTTLADVGEPRWWPAPERRGSHAGTIRGLFAGGTLAQEAAAIVPAARIVDFGDDRFTQGRPHPMIDQRARLEAIAAVRPDDVLLLDVVLGYGAHPDPAAELAPAIAAVVRRGTAAVVSLCGTANDPQGRDRQVQALVEAGASVHLSNARAARAARKAADLGSPA